jgi:peptide/nickel transport system permease protein
MLSYITRRVLLAIPVLIGIVIVVFVLVRAIPGDPCTSLLGERATEEACERFDEANGLNEPVWVQLGIYMKNVVTFDLGESIRFSRPVNQLLIERLPLTTELALSALALAVLVGVPLGVLAARRHNTIVDTGTMALANIGVSMPVFWLGLMLAYMFALVLKDTPFVLPPSGRLSAGIPRVRCQPLHLQQLHHSPVGSLARRGQAHDSSRGCAGHDSAVHHCPYHP